MEGARTATILLVEDSEADIELVKHCLKKNKIHVNLIVIENGHDAVEFLFKQGEYKDAVTPDIILLDVNLPGMNGIDVLGKIKESEETKFIPVVMLTCSSYDEDIIKSYNNHANCFLQKPLELESFQRIMDTFEQFWLTLVKLPTHAKNH